jgi:hypothetical protein
MPIRFFRDSLQGIQYQLVADSRREGIKVIGKPLTADFARGRWAGQKLPAEPPRHGEARKTQIFETQRN